MTTASIRQPSSATAGVAFSMGGSTNLRNLGPLANVTGDATLVLTLPADCSASTSTTRTVAGLALPINTNVFTSVSWSVTCTQSGNHTFGLTSTVAPSSSSVVDPNSANNSFSTSVTFTVG